MRLLVGTRILKLDETESTNSYCKELFNNNSNDLSGLAVVANYQKAGRGQRENFWLSEPGKNLTFSIILDTSFIPTDRLFTLNQCVSVAICEFSSAIGIKTLVKWPNDIYWGSKKLGGILIETLSHSPTKRTSIIGIGYNVNQKTWPNKLNATSLCLINQKENNLDLLFNELLNFLDAHLLRLKNNLNSFEANYLANLLGYKTERVFIDSSGKFKGTIEGIDSSGKLKILKDGNPIFYDLKEIQFEF